MSSRRITRLAALSCLLALSASLAVAVPASAAEDAIAISVSKDGNGPFTPGDGPGLDSSSSNGVVRTFDAVTYRVGVNSVGGESPNETVTLTAPIGTEWHALPEHCTGPGSGVVGRVLTCNLGTLGNESREFQASLVVTSELGDGSSVAISGTVSSEASDPSSAVSPATRVSAAPRYDLSKNVANPILKTDVTGPDGKTKGLSVTYPVAISWQSEIAGQGLLGLERLTGDLSFTDDVSKMFGPLPSPAVLLPGGCSANSAALFRNLPASSGGAPRGVIDSGTVTCRQDHAGGPVSVSITGLDTSAEPETLPTSSVSGETIVGGQKAYVGVLALTLWLPVPPADDSFLARDTFSPLQATSITGQANVEPDLVDNVADLNLSNLQQGGGFKSYGLVAPDGSTLPVSGKISNPWVTPGTVMRSQVDLKDVGITPFTGAIACDVFDNTVQTLTKGPGGVYAKGTAGGTIEYAASTWTTPQAARDSTCKDSDGPWFTDPTRVPGGPSKVGEVRLTHDVAGGSAIDLFTYLAITTPVDRTRVRNFGQLNFGGAGWTHETVSADAANGGLSDFLVVTSNLARITRKIVDPGYTPITTPDATTSVAAGGSYEVALYPTLTNSTKNPKVDTVTITETLPAGTAYREGSASLAPARLETVKDPDGMTHQVVTWVIPNATVNMPLPVITYTADVSPDAPATSLLSSVEISSDGDVSDVEARVASRSVRALSIGGVRVDKTAIVPTILPGDAASWKLGLVNTDDRPIDGVALIDVLPTDGDASGSHFSGTVRLAAPLATPDPADRVSYTAAVPSTISLDPGASSNAAGGSTRWCPIDAFGTTGCPKGIDAATGIRITHPGTVDVGQRIDYPVTLAASGQHDGDTVSNRFGLRASNLELPVVSNTATVTVRAGSIGSIVWIDSNANGVQDAGEKGAAKVSVALTGTDDRGRPVTASTTTDKAGHYLFAGLRPGAYSVDFTKPKDTAWTKRHTGDPAKDSDVSTKGLATTKLAREETGDALVGVSSSLHVDAGLVAAEPAPSPSPTPIDHDGDHSSNTTRPTPPIGDATGHSGGSGGSQHGVLPAHLAFTGSTFDIALVALAALLAGLFGFALVRRSKRQNRES